MPAIPAFRQRNHLRGDRQRLSRKGFDRLQHELCLRPDKQACCQHGQAHRLKQPLPAHPWNA